MNGSDLSSPNYHRQAILFGQMNDDDSDGESCSEDSSETNFDSQMNDDDSHGESCSEVSSETNFDSSKVSCASALSLIGPANVIPTLPPSDFVKKFGDDLTCRIFEFVPVYALRGAAKRFAGTKRRRTFVLLKNFDNLAAVPSGMGNYVEERNIFGKLHGKHLCCQLCGKVDLGPKRQPESESEGEFETEHGYISDVVGVEFETFLGDALCLPKTTSMCQFLCDKLQNYEEVYSCDECNGNSGNCLFVHSEHVLDAEGSLTIDVDRLLREMDLGGDRKTCASGTRLLPLMFPATSDATGMPRALAVPSEEAE